MIGPSVGCQSLMGQSTMNDSLIKHCVYGIDCDLYNFINIRPIKSVVNLIYCEGITESHISDVKAAVLLFILACVLGT